jgi:hypothetical protein
MAPISVLSVVPQQTGNNDSLHTGASSGPSQSVTYYSAASIAPTTNGGAASSYASNPVPEDIGNVSTPKRAFVEVTPTPTETAVSKTTALQVIEASPTFLTMDGQPVTVAEATNAVTKHDDVGGAFRIVRPQDPATKWFAIISVCLVSGLALGGVVCCVIECMDRRYESELIMPSVIDLYVYVDALPSPTQGKNRNSMSK